MKFLSHYLPLDPNHPGQQSIDLVKNFTSGSKFEVQHDDQNGSMIVMTTSDGKKVGLSPSNADQYDLGLGLKALLISMYFDFDQDPISRPTPLDFDAKLKALESIVIKLGADANQVPVSSGVTYCSSLAPDSQQ